MESKSIFEMSTTLDDAIIRNSTISPKKLEALSLEITELCSQSKATEAFSHLVDRASMILKCDDASTTKINEMFDTNEARRISTFLLRPQNNSVPSNSDRKPKPDFAQLFLPFTSAMKSTALDSDDALSVHIQSIPYLRPKAVIHDATDVPSVPVVGNNVNLHMLNNPKYNKKKPLEKTKPSSSATVSAVDIKEVDVKEMKKDKAHLSGHLVSYSLLPAGSNLASYVEYVLENRTLLGNLLLMKVLLCYYAAQSERPSAYLSDVPGTPSTPQTVGTAAVDLGVEETKLSEYASALSVSSILDGKDLRVINDVIKEVEHLTTLISPPHVMLLSGSAPTLVNQYEVVGRATAVVSNVCIRPSLQTIKAESSSVTTSPSSAAAGGVMSNDKKEEQEYYYFEVTLKSSGGSSSGRSTSTSSAASPTTNTTTATANNNNSSPVVSASFQDFRIGLALCGTNLASHLASAGGVSPGASLSRTAASSLTSSSASQLTGSSDSVWVYDIDNQHFYHDAARLAKERKDAATTGGATGSPRAMRLSRQVSGASSGENEEDQFFFDMFQEIVDAAPGIPDAGSEGDRAESVEVSAANASAAAAAAGGSQSDSLSNNLYSCLFDSSPPRVSSAKTAAATVAADASAAAGAASGATIARSASNSDAMNTPVTTTPANNTSSPTPVPLSPRLSASSGGAASENSTSTVASNVATTEEDTFASSLRRMLAARGVTESDEPATSTAAAGTTGASASAGGASTSSSLFEVLGSATLPATGRGSEPVDANLPSDLRAALSKSFTLPAEIVTSKQSPFSASMKKKSASQLTVDKYTLAHQTGGVPLNRGSTTAAAAAVESSADVKYSPVNVLLADGSIVGCFFHLKTGELKYFVNGMYVGTAPVLINSTTCKAFATNGVTPIVSNSLATAGFEINIGQSPFKYADVVTAAQQQTGGKAGESATGASAVKSPASSVASSMVSAAISAATKRKQTAASAAGGDAVKDAKASETPAPSIGVINAKCSSYLNITQSAAALSQLSDSSSSASSTSGGSTNKGSGVVFSNLTSDAFKTVTFEATVRLATPEQRGGRSSTSYTLFHSCASSSCSSAGSSTVDGGCQMGVNTNGSLYFEMNGYNAVTTSQCPIVAGVWHHVSFVYTFHRSTNKSTAAFYHNGQLLSCLDVVSSGNSSSSISSSKVGKILPRTVCFGGLLGTNRYTLASSARGWEGDVAEARVWVSSRTDSEIAQSLGRSRMLPFFTDAELLCCASFEEGCGKTLHDNSVKVGGVIHVRGTETIMLCGSYTWCSLPSSAASLDSLSISSILADKHSSKDAVVSAQKEFKSTLDGVPAKNERTARVLLTSLSQFIDRSKDKYTNDATEQGPAGLFALRQLQYSLPSSLASSIDPSEVNLLMINSLLRQTLSLINARCTAGIPPAEGDVQLLIPLCLSLLRLLQMNLIAINESTSAASSSSSSSAGGNLNYSAAKFDLMSSSSKSEVMTKLLITLLALVSGIAVHPAHKHDLHKHLVTLRAAALEVLVGGIDLLVPSSNNQLFLIECLLLKKYRHLYESRTEKKTATPVLFSEVLALIPSAEGEFFHPTKPNVSLPCDAVVALLNLSEEGNTALFLALSQLVSQTLRASDLMSRRYWPLYKTEDFSTFTSGKAISDIQYVRPRPGDVVMRGPHWRYGEQDGGSGSVGIVVEVVPWLDQPDRGVVVEWRNSSSSSSGSKTINTYRYGVSDSGVTSPSSQEKGGSFSLEKAEKLIYDVSVMIPTSVNVETLNTAGGGVGMGGNGTDVDSAGKSSSPAPKGKGGESGTEYTRKILDYTPTEVRTALSTADEQKGNTSLTTTVSGVPAKQLTKRLVLLYMKNNTPPDWQEKHKLMRSLNSLIVKLNSNEVIAIYNDFFNDFSAVSEKSFAGGSGGGGNKGGTKEKLKFLPIEPRGKSFHAEGQFENRLSVLFSCLMKESSDGGASEGAVRLLLALQAAISGVLGSRYDAVKDVNLGTPSPQLIDTPFKCRDGTLLMWDWTKGIWCSAATATAALSGSSGVACKADAAEKTVDQSGAKILTEFVVDPISIPDHIHAVNNESSFDIIQSSDRSFEQQQEEGNEWNSFVANNCVMAPNTGIYKWFLTMKNVLGGQSSNNNTSRSSRPSLSSGSVCMIGVSTLGFSTEDFIGADGESWAISTNNFDLFHAGRKKRSSSSSLNSSAVGRSLRKHSLHDGTTIIAVTLDTNKGHLNFKVYSNDETDAALSLSYDNLSGKTVYPAFSLYTPGDCISLFTSPSQIDTLIHHEGSGASLLAKLGSKDSPVLQAPSQRVRPACMGAPQPVLVDYALELMRHTMESLTALAERQMTSLSEEASVQEDMVAGVCLVQVLASLNRYDHIASHRQSDLVDACVNLLLTIKNTIHIFFAAPPSTEFGGGFSEKTISTVGALSISSQQKNSSYDLLTQLSCLVAAYLNSLSRYNVMGSGFDAIDNQALARQKLSYKSFMSPGHSLYTVSNECFKYDPVTGISSSNSSAKASSNSKNGGGGDTWFGLSPQLLSQGFRFLPQITSILDPNSAGGSASVISNEVLLSLYKGTKNVESFLQWIAAHDKTHKTYSKLGGDELNTAVRCIFVACLYHLGCSQSVTYCFNAFTDHIKTLKSGSVAPTAVSTEDLMTFKPPYYLSACYEHAMKIRVWARDTAKEHGLSLEYLGQRIVYRSLFLFELEPCGGDLPFQTMSVKDTFPAWSTSQSTPHGKKKLTQLLLAVRSFVVDSSSLDHIRASFATTIQRANRRISGLRALKKALESVPTEIGDGVKIALFHQSLLRNVEPTEMLRSQYLVDLDYLCKRIKSEVQSAFHSLFTAWTDELSLASQELHVGAEDGTGAECSPYSLCLLDCCGVSLSEEDHGMLCEINFFNALEELINSCSADKEHIASPAPASVDDSQPPTATTAAASAASSGNNTSFSNKIMKVALKLFIFIALQVASTSENLPVQSDKFSLLSPVTNSGKGGVPAVVPMKRVKSGLDSLSKSVFDILYTQLYNVLNAVYAAAVPSVVASTASPEMVVTDIVFISSSAALVLNETTMLLLHVSSNASCQQIMSKPKWLLLLLKMSCIKHSVTQQRALLLLRDILPLVNVSKNAIAGVNRSELLEVLHVKDTEHSVADLVVLHFFELIGRTLLSSYYQGSRLVLSEGSDRLRELAEYSLPLISESISLCRFLYCDSHWHPIVHSLLVSSLASGVEVVSRTDRRVERAEYSVLLSSLSILGGHIDALYRNCMVKFEHPHTLKNLVGTFVDYSENSLDKLVISHVGSTESVVNATLVVNADRVTPVSRCAAERLVLSSEIVSALVKLLDSLLSPSTHSVAGSDELETNEKNGTVFCCLVADVKSLLTSSCCRVFSSIAANSRSTHAALQELLEHSASAASGCLQQLLELSQKPTKAAGLPDIPVYEDYLLNLLQQRQKLHLVDFQQKQAKEAPAKATDKPTATAATETAAPAPVDLSVNPAASAGELGAHAQILKHILELQRQSGSSSRGGIPRRLDDESRAENWTNIWAAEPESSAGSISDLERTLGSSTLSESNNLNTTQVLTIMSNSVDFDAGESAGDQAAATTEGTSNSNNGNGSEYGEYEDEGSTGGGAMEEHNQLVQTLEAMGFPAENASIALDLCGDDIDEALNYILSNAAQLDDMVAAQRQARAAAAEKKESVRAAAPETAILRSPARTRSTSESAGSQIKSSVDVTPSLNFYTSQTYTQFIPFYAAPSLDSERVGGVAPNEDLKVLEELVTECEAEYDDKTSRVWYKLNLSSIRDGTCQKLPSLLSEINSASSHSGAASSVYIYIPKFYQSTQVVFSGTKPTGASVTLSTPPGLSLSVNRVYMVVGGNGALVRETRELSSKELTTLPSGTLVQAVEETYNSEGTLRLRIVSPLSGWISKLANLLALVSCSTAAFTGSQEVPFENEYEQLSVLVEDKFEFNLQSNENFHKEDRFFGGKQGLQYEKYISASDIGPSGASAAMSALSNRRIRITGSNNPTGLYSVLSGLSAKAVDELIAEVLSILKRLHCRKMLTALMLTSMAPMDTPAETSGEIPELFQLLLSSAMSSLKSGSTDTDKPMVWFPNYKFKLARAGKDTPVEKDEGCELLDKLVKLVRLLVFRGDPYTRSDLESLALSNVSVACLLAESNQSVTMETVLEHVLGRLLQYGGVQLSHRLSGLLVESLIYNVKLVCSDMFVDHCWADACYDEDLDEELVASPLGANDASANASSVKTRVEMQPSVHYMTWLTHILLRLNDTAVTLQVFKCWLIALRGASLSLKLCVFDALVAIISTINGQVVAHDNALPSPVPRASVECDHLRLLKTCLTLLPVKQLNLVAQRRLWFEMEDAPMYSRFLQSLLELVSIADISAKIIEEHNASGSRPLSTKNPVVSEGRAVIQFKSSSGSHLQLPKTRDQTGSWTLECWVKLMPVEMEEGSIPDQPLKPVYLLSSSRGSVLLRTGGKVLSGEALEENGDSHLQGAYCVSVQAAGCSACIFDYRLPENVWTHLAIVYDSAGNKISLFIDGDLVDGISVTSAVQLPLGAVGYNFQGQLAGMRIFTSAKSALEIKRDLRSAVVHTRGDLLFNVLCNEGKGGATFDTAEVFNSTVSLVNCEWVQSSDAPLTTMPDASTVAATPDESESNDGVELSGILQLTAVPGANEEDPFAKDSSEVVNVWYRTVSTDAAGVQQISGYLHWCEREVRSSIKGILNPTTSEIAFTLDPDSTVLGPPETMSSWLMRLSFEGKIINRSELNGSCRIEALVNGLPELAAGATRIDRLALLDNESISYCTNTDNYSGIVAEVLTIEDSVEEAGKFIATVEIQPAKGDNVTQYGIQSNQGQFFIEWQINTNASDSIVFGLCTSTAFDHPDSSVEVNDLTWVYNVAGQSSHGFSEMSECEAASDGDVISVQIDTENDGGTLRFYKNYEFLVQFDSVFSGLTNINAAAAVEDATKGLRPFLCLVSAKDSVSFLGAKPDGDIDLFYSESDAQRRTQFTGTLTKGALTGYASLGIRRESSTTVDYWFGMWENNLRTGYHILMKNESDTAATGEDSANITNDAAAAAAAAIAGGVSDQLPSIHDDGSPEVIDVTPSKIALYERGVLTQTWEEGCEEQLAASPELKEKVAVVQEAYKVFVSPLSGLDSSGLFDLSEDVVDLTTKTSAAGTSGAAAESNEDTTMTLFLHNFNTSDSNSDTQQYKINRSDPLSVVFNHYVAAKFGAGRIASQYTFTFEDKPVLGSEVPATYSLSDGDVIDVSVTSLNSTIATEEQIDEFVARSSARFVIQVIYPAGATVRGTVEIEDSQPWRTVGYCTILEAFDRKVTLEGIVRFQLADGGWLSERLRGGTEAQVVQILKHNHPEPLKFKVIRADGAKIRSTSDLESAVVGHCPVNTIVTVRVSEWVVDEPEDGHDEDQDDKLSSRRFVHRVRIDEPEEYVGWISNKENIIQAVSDATSAAAATESADSAVTPVDPDVKAELNRRSAAASRRQERETQAAQRLKKLKNKRSVVISGSLTASQNTFFLLNKSKSSSSLTVSDDCSTVTCMDGGSGRVMVLGSKGFTSGVHYWEVLVNAASWGGVFIGVSVGDTSGWNGYGFLNYRATQCYGSETLYGSYYAVGDKVGVLLDMNRGTISFFKDGEDFNIGKANVVNMGVAYHELRRQSSSRGSYRSNFMPNNNGGSNEVKFYPCLGLKSAGDSLSIFNSHWCSQRGETPSQLMSRVTQSRHFLHQWASSYEMTSKQWLSSSLVDTLYEAYVTSQRSKDFVPVVCRAGLTVTVNVSNRELQRIVDPDLFRNFNISVGAHVRTQYGPAHIIGSVNGTQIWYNYRGTTSNKESNWYWNTAELSDLINCGTIGFESKEEDSSSTDADGNASATAAAAIAAVPPPVAMSRLSSDCIHQSLLDCHWTQQEDEVLVPLINSIASKNELNPFEIPLTDFPELVKAALLSCPSAANRASLSDKSDIDILVRYMALCQLNKAVNNILPFVDLNSGDNRDRLMRSDIARFSLLNNHNAGQNGSYCYYYTASRALKLLKGVIFTSVKQAMWNAAIAESTTRTGAPADEYERPDDLTEIVINRMEARNMEKLKDVTPFAEKLRVSVFGQLYQHMRSSLHFRDDSALRRSFVHIQDGNQSRAFYVKFIGEGVDDNGGPYRAVFQSAIGEEITSLLDLVLPCPNAVGEVGENRDKYVLNGNLLLNAEDVAPGLNVFSSVPFLYTHLGKMIGLACRQGILSPLSLSSLFWKSLAGDCVSVQDLAAIDNSLINSLKYILSSGSTFEPDSHELELLMHALQVAVSKHVSASALTHSPVVSVLQECVSQLTHSSLTGADPTSLIDLIEQLHLTSEAAVMRLLYKGLSASLPVELMSIFTSEELEVLFCGEAQVDTQTLRRAVVYEDGVTPSDSHIEYFWTCLEELTSEERALFVNFCSGRSRLPLAASDFPMPFKLVGPPTHSEKNPDNYLPIARTCFFTLSLPKYTSKEVCLEKLKYAIRNTELMDADFIDRKGTQGWDNIR